MTPSARISSPWSSGSGNVTTTPSRPPAAGGWMRHDAVSSGCSSGGPTRSARRKSSFSGSPCSSRHSRLMTSVTERPDFERTAHLLVRQDAVLHAARDRRTTVKRV